MTLPDYGIIFPDNSSINILPAEKYAEKFILTKKESNEDLTKSTLAQLFGINKDSTFILLSEDGDVYELLDRTYNLSNYIGIIVFTKGWAAPLNPNNELDGVPSQHPERRRIALAACVTSASTGSALSFSDNPEVILDPGSATGSLAQALSNFWALNN